MTLVLRFAAPILALALLSGIGLARAPAAMANSDPKRHAVSLLGEPKFASDFKHFDWVNPSAPKGGIVRRYELGTFDSLNPYTVKGQAADDLGLIFDTLLTTSPDEPATEYGLVAEWVSHPSDFSSVTFGLRSTARFHDGKPITVEDVIFSLEQLKKTHPQFNFYYKNVVEAEKSGEREVTFRFDEKNNRELPQIVGQLPILPKHFWEAKDDKGEARDLAKSTLEIPLGSGPYKIKSVDAGRAITYERVKDYWAADLPVMRGQWNFDEIRIVYFRDRTPAFEAFKVGQIDFWRESSAKQWATAYDFEATKKGLVKLHKIPLKTVAGMQGFAFNLRRPQFQDPRVRRAFNLAFDFETANKNLFYDQYIRIGSYFDNSELAARGRPEGRELEILKEVENMVPPEVFTTEWKNPVNNAPEDVRRNMAEASKLLAAAGWVAKNGTLANAEGRELAVEFLIVQPDFERVALPFKIQLERLGIKVAIRTVDTSQYKRRIDTADFDIIVQSIGQSLSPGNEQREYWGSAAADREGSRNRSGIKNPAIDKLIERLIFATDRADLIAATKALDRVLLWNHYIVPQWHLPYDRLATWDVYAHPPKLPSQSSSFLRTWWVDPDKAKAMQLARPNP